MHLTDSEPLIYEIAQNDEYGLRIEVTLDVVCQVISSPFLPASLIRKGEVIWKCNDGIQT